MREPVLKLRGISKRFPGVVANDQVDLDVYPGEVHALLGENGAGKTTLMNILYGFYQPDEGQIELSGRPVRIGSPAEAMRLGIGLVPQHPLLVRRHSVAENLALGLPTGWWRPTKPLGKRLHELKQQYRLDVEAGALVEQLSPGEKQRVEIIRALLRGAKILILDEPTSVLTPQEAGELFKVIQRITQSGGAVLFISHRLDEVLEIANRVTVLRKGKAVGSLTPPTDKATLAEMMVGRQVSFERERGMAKRGAPVLEVQKLSVFSDRGLPALRSVSFNLHQGEVLGVAGVAGNGQSELIQVLAGLRKAVSGSVKLDGRDITGKTPRQLHTLGVAHVPEDRIRMGVVPSMSVAQNLALRNYFRPPFSKGLWLDQQELDQNALRQIRQHEIAAPKPGTEARLLSGGNIQKIILARELAGNLKVILAVHPTYGLDVGASEQVHATLLQKTQEGAAVLLVSEDLDEIISLSDRVGVLYAGELVGPVEATSVTREQIGLWMMRGETASTTIEA